MRRWIALAASLYPPSWRGRYAEEFDALLEDHNPGWREFTDVLRGALKMQMTNSAAYWKLGGGLAIAGAIVATGVSFRIPRIYESTAVMRITPQQLPEKGFKEALQDQVASHLNQMEQEILSRTNLEGIVTHPGLDLYKEERSREPMEDIIQRMRSRDIRIQPLNPQGPAFSVSFSYPDQRKAEAVVRMLTAQFIQENLAVNRTQALLWQGIWAQAPPPGPSLDVIDPPTLSQKPINARPLSFAAVGLAVGLALGLLAAVAMQRPKWTLQMAGFAIGCCALAFTVSLLLPETYTSSAVMHLTPPLVPPSPTGEIAAGPPAGKLQRLEDPVLSDFMLGNIIAVAGLDLYKKQLEQKPMDEVAAAMRRNISIRPVNQSQSAFRISFSYPDPAKAQAAVRELITRFTEQNVVDERARARESGDAKVIEIAEHMAAVNLEVLDPASDPQEPDSPNRLAIALAGFTAGLLLGAITLYRRQHRSQTLQTA